MSTSASPALHKFFVHAPDKTDPDAFARRLSVRSKHLEVAKKGIDDGSIRVGGALLTPESLLSNDKKMIGSVFIIEAENIETVQKAIEGDIYYTSGVWDPERIVILPFVAATPFSLTVVEIHRNMILTMSFQLHTPSRGGTALIGPAEFTNSQMESMCRNFSRNPRARSVCGSQRAGRRSAKMLEV
ncbi:YCII domain-containing protein [Mycena venus]|uniref:YCII domain-containing protein n=1 Tax=Mycena venus TaxID=2733690 RepID=A0A8H7CUK8_9AGAR|nr:YCII domain-containing protein [Mycena venus]